MYQTAEMLVLADNAQLPALAEWEHRHRVAPWTRGAQCRELTPALLHFSAVQCE